MSIFRFLLNLNRFCLFIIKQAFPSLLFILLYHLQFLGFPYHFVVQRIYTPICSLLCLHPASVGICHPLMMIINILTSSWIFIDLFWSPQSLAMKYLSLLYCIFGLSTDLRELVHCIRNFLILIIHWSQRIYRFQPSLIILFSVHLSVMMMIAFLLSSILRAFQMLTMINQIFQWNPLGVRISH